MTRVLEIVLGLPLPGGDAPASRRRAASRAARDFGLELVRAWRICPPVRMRRGSEHGTIEALALADAVPHAQGWLAWRETDSAGIAIAHAVRAVALVPGVTLRERLDGAAPAAGPGPGSDSVAGPESVAAAAAAREASRSEPPGQGEANERDTLDRLVRALSDGALAPLTVSRAAADARPSGAAASGGTSPAPVAGPGDVCRLTRERRRGRWQRDGGVPVELTLDDLRWAGGAGRACELHLSVSDTGDEAGRVVAIRALFDAARELSGAWPAFLKPVSLIDRLCAGELPDTIDAPVRAASVDLTEVRASAALGVLAGNVAAQWLGNDAGVRERRDVEYVHQMRVALRRLRTLIRLFPDLTDDAYHEAFDADLAWLGAQLGVVRDWDVCVDETLPALIDADPDIAGVPAWDATLEAATRQRDVARGELRQAVASARYARLVLSWIEWLAVRVLGGAAAEPAPAPLRLLRRHAVRRVDKLFGKLYSVPKLTTLDPAARHQVRINAKRLRYALEFLASIASRRTRGSQLRLLARVQAALGAANDADVVLRHLERLPAPAEQLGFARGYGAATQHYAAREAEGLLGKLKRPKLRRARRRAR